jgi:hypothetical protein
VRVWRRFHNHQFVANVLLDGTAYVVAVWHDASGRVRKLERRFRQLQSAQAAADHLVRHTFKHRCTVDHCGDWLVWTA